MQLTIFKVVKISIFNTIQAFFLKVTKLKIFSCNICIFKNQNLTKKTTAKNDQMFHCCFFFFFFNWDSFQRLNSHYEAWSFQKKKHKNIKAYWKFVQTEPTHGLIQKIRLCAGHNKKGQKIPIKEHKCGFLPLFPPNLGHLEYYTPKQHVFLSFLVENKAFCF